MIINFEEYTHDLTKDEEKIVPIIIKGLQNKIGKSNAVSGTYIIETLKQYKQIKIRPERLRKIINFIRLNDFVPCLCSTSKGYFIAHTNEELHEYIKSLNERADALNTLREALNRQYKYRNKQTSMF